MGVVIPRHAGGGPPGPGRPAFLGKGAVPPLHPPMEPGGLDGAPEMARSPAPAAHDRTPEAAAGRKPKRKREQVLTIRADDAERAELEERASKAGLTLGAYLRACGLGDAGPRARLRPPVERALLARTNAEINRVGSNLNQIARTLNIAALEEAGLAEQVADLDRLIAVALAELSAALAAIRGALGHDRQG